MAKTMNIIMRKRGKLMLLVVAILLVVACVDTKKKLNNQLPNRVTEAKAQIADSTIYGTCGEETSMHTLQLITLQGDTINFVKDVDESVVLHGGLLVGDKLAIISHKNSDDENVATIIINITTLLGKWRSIDKQFEVYEDGTIKSNVSVESKVWTSWKLYNGKLLLNKDTFEINALGADSLYLENKEGIFTYARQK